MEGNPVAPLDHWRRVFRGVAASGDGDIFDVIENAIVVAALDCPREFRVRRDSIAEKLFTVSTSAGGSSCPHCYRAGGGAGDREEGDGSVKRDVEKESKAGSCTDGPEDLRRVLVSCSYDEAEALTKEMEEESQIFEEILRIRQVLFDRDDQSDSVLFDSLRRLQLMHLSVETLEATEIGKAVNGLRKHNSKQIRQLARTLIEGWKSMVDEWVQAASELSEKMEDDAPASEKQMPLLDEEEHGLALPPMDESALLAAAHSGPIQLSQIFDGMDDDGNLRNAGELDDFQKPFSKHDISRRPLQPPRRLQQQQQPRLLPPRPKQPLNADDTAWMRRKEPEARQRVPKQTSSPQPTLPHPAFEVPTHARPLMKSASCGSEMKHRHTQGSAPVLRKPELVQMDKSDCSEEATVRAKLELAKRKLHEGYQQAENAKKQRTIQVMELHDIPKPAHQSRAFDRKPKTHPRSCWASGRH